MKKKMIQTKKNTWKMKRELESEDWLSILVCVLIFILVIIQVMR